MNRRVREKMELGTDQQRFDDDSTRVALGKLGTKSARSTFRKSSISQQGVRVPIRATSSSIQNSNSKPVTVFEDPAAAAVQPLVHSMAPTGSDESKLWHFFPTEKEKRKENELDPSTWSENGGIMSSTSSVSTTKPSSSSIIVFDDEVPRQHQPEVEKDENNNDSCLDSGMKTEVSKQLELNEDMTINTKVAFAAVSDMFSSPGFSASDGTSSKVMAAAATPSFNEPIERQLHFSVFEDNTVDDVQNGIDSLSVDAQTVASAARRPLGAIPVKKITNAEVLRSETRTTPVRIFEDSPQTKLNLVFEDPR